MTIHDGFDLTLLWLCNSVYNDEATMDEHCHEYFQIYLVRNGKAYFTLNGESIVFTQNMVVFANPGDLHGISKVEPVDGRPFEMLEIKFAVGETRLSKELSSIPGHFAAQDDVVDLISNMFSEGKNQKEFCEEVLSCMLCTLLYKLLRKESVDSAGQKASGSRQIHIAEQIEEYITLNYDSEISLDDIAEHVGCNKNYICRVYRNHTGSTINTFLNNVRIKRAAELLLQTDMELEEIAVAVGYNSIYHFMKTFKRIMKISPGSYRRRNLSGSELVRNPVYYENIYTKIGLVDKGIHYNAKQQQPD